MLIAEIRDTGKAITLGLDSCDVGCWRTHRDRDTGHTEAWYAQANGDGLGRNAHACNAGFHLSMVKTNE